MRRTINGKAIVLPDRELDELREQIRQELDDLRRQTSQISTDTNQQLEVLREYVSRLEVSLGEFDQRLQKLGTQSNKNTNQQLKGLAEYVNQLAVSIQEINTQFSRLEGRVNRSEAYLFNLPRALRKMYVWIAVSNLFVFVSICVLAWLVLTK